ncbi:MAG: 4Fe-4S binding protein [Coriobacteriales bacterium]|jgi:pyruvate ferredoxin oxidoreductase delta subunit|nr:4Fe-4S binding protein [Coriobacteriales bacterium]
MSNATNTTNSFAAAAPAAKPGTWDVSNFDNWKASEFPLGAIAIEAGNSTQYKTGGWRSNRPVWNQPNCKNCMLCWVHCPDSSIEVEDGVMTGIDYGHCKGCGVCVIECKFDALKMVPEGTYAEEGA